MNDWLNIICGDALAELHKLPAESVQCCVTSPPYWGLRDYAHADQLGLERTPEEYVTNLVAIMREVRRVLRKDGTLWLNLGDTYSSGGRDSYDPSKVSATSGLTNNSAGNVRYTPPWAKPKDLIGIPWMVAFALRADGWYLRSDIIWNKPNPMPESVTDRPTKSHEYIFLLTRSPVYFYDAESIKEVATGYDGRKDTIMHGSPKYVTGDNLPLGTNVHSLARGNRERWKRKHDDTGHGANGGGFQNHSGYSELENPYVRNKRSVWTVNTSPYADAHFATYPPDLIKPCILAGTSAKGCCARCGAPWERVVEQTGPSTYAKVKGERSWREMSAIANEQGTTPSRPNSGQTRFENGTQPHLDAAPTKTLGWQPTCVCSDQVPFEIAFPTPVPCTVLDPFAGSGTTGAVALELGRRAVLIELNPKYIELIQQRCDVTPGLALA